MRILFCGLSGIPNNSSAPINRYLAIAQALSDNNEVIFINRIPIISEENQLNWKNLNNIKIVDATGIKYRPKSFLKRNWLKLNSFRFEYKVISRLNKEKEIDWLNVYTQFFSISLFYFLLSKLFHFKIVLHYVEFRSEIKSRNFLYRINDYLFDKYSFSLCDKIMPISTFLNDHVKGIKPNSQTLIIPPLCDFVYCNSISSEIANRKYFVYCGSASYEEVLLFIIQSFLQIDHKKEVDLHLVISGKITNAIITNIIEENNESIKIFSKLDYEKLIAKYKGSLAQLIPLRNTIQDRARFPQKICEYLASKRPLITTNFGEMPHYFVDNENAIIADNFTLESFASKLQWAVNNQSQLVKIANESYKTGCNSFDINSSKLKLENFLNP